MRFQTLRIEALRLQPYALAFRTPFPTAHGTWRERRGLLLWLADEAGLWAVGEAAPLPDFGTESLTDCEAVLRGLSAEALSSGLPAALPSALDAAGPHTPPLLQELARGAPAAAHALEQAWLSLLALRAGLPLARLLHPRAPSHVAVNATLGASDPATAAEEARRYVREQGYRTLKIKVGVGGEAADTARLQAVRAAVDGVRGDLTGGVRCAAAEGAGGASPRAAVALRVDANGAWNEAQAQRLLEAWRPLGLEYVEQPLPPGQESAMARLTRKGGTPIAADESVRNETTARAVLDLGAAQVLVLKPMVLGGLLPALRITRLAAQRGVPVVFSSALDSAVGRAGALHGAAAAHALMADAGLPPPPACGLATGDLLAEDFADGGLRPEQGAVAVPQEPGTGLRWAPGLHFPAPQRLDLAQAIRLGKVL